MGAFLRGSTWVNSGATNLLNPSEACNTYLTFELPRVNEKYFSFAKIYVFYSLLTPWVDFAPIHTYSLRCYQLNFFFPFEASNNVGFTVNWTMLSLSIKKKKQPAVRKILNLHIFWLTHDVSYTSSKVTVEIQYSYLYMIVVKGDGF